MSSRLLLAFVLSIALHTSVLLWDTLDFTAKPAPVAIEASLRQPQKPQPRAAAPLLKNTLSADPAVKPSPPAPPVNRAAPSVSKSVAKRQVEAAQRKLSQHLYYPPEAVARGLEGEVHLLLIVSDDGGISDVSIAGSSGHAILDRAAVRAAYAMGKVNWNRSRELILPVIFRLE